MDIHLNCPIPFTDSDRVLLAHGGGGRMTHQLISQVFYPAFRNPLLEQDHDGCVFPMEEGIHQNRLRLPLTHLLTLRAE